MKKKIVAIMLSAALAMSFTACGNSDTSKADTKKEETSKDDGTLKAEKNILSVEVTLPASMINGDSTTLTDEAKAAGVKEITQNDDGSITMKMTKSAHKNFLIPSRKVSIKAMTKCFQTKKIILLLILSLTMMILLNLLLMSIRLFMAECRVSLLLHSTWKEISIRH